MSDSLSPRPSGPDPLHPEPAPPGLPARRNEGEVPRRGAADEGEDSARISLDEMMERLQRSSGSGSGGGRSSSGSVTRETLPDGGEIRVRRRRRSSSSPSSSGEGGAFTSSGQGRSSSSRHRSGESRRDPYGEDPSSGESSRGYSRRSRSSAAPPASPEPRRQPALPGGQGESAADPLPRAILPPPRKTLTAGDIPPARLEFQPAGATGGRKRRRWLLWGLAGLGLLAGGTWLGLRALNSWRIEGDGFSVNVARRVSELSGREVFLSRFRQAGGDQLILSTARLSPVPTDLLGDVSFEDISAKLTPGSWMGDNWTVEILRFKKGNLVFQPGKPLPEGASLYALRPGPVNRGPLQSGGFRLSINSDPSSIAVEAGRFEELNLSWPGPGGGKEDTLRELAGNFRLMDGTMQIESTGGVLDTGAWPAMAVNQINARLRGTDLEIVSARLGLTPGHDIRLTGSARLVPDGTLQLQGEIPPILLRHVLPEAWGTSLMGSFQVPEAAWVSHFGKGPAATLAGKFKVSGFVLRNMPWVEKTAALLRKPDLILMEFPVLTGEFSWTPEGTRVTGLTAVSKDGLLRFSGEAGITGTEGAVTGKIRMEASEAFFAGLPADAPQQLFTATGEEGWRALTITLGGREGNVLDDIGIAKPTMINPGRLPSLEAPSRLDTPGGVAAPAPAPAASSAPPQPAATPASPPPVRPLPLPPPPAPKGPPTEAELKKMEQDFHDLLGR